VRVPSVIFSSIFIVYFSVEYFERNLNALSNLLTRLDSYSPALWFCLIVLILSTLRYCVIIIAWCRVLYTHEYPIKAKTPVSSTCVLKDDMF